MYNDIHKLFMESSVLDEKENLTFNFNKWERNSPHNLLYITGHSGSGKSTLSEDLAKEYNAKIFEIDFLEWYILDPKEDTTNDDIRIRTLINDFKKVEERVNMEWDELSDEERGEIIYDYIQFIKEYVSDNRDKLFIIEGLQIYEQLQSELNNEPVIIKDTGSLKAFYRRLKRDNGGEELNLFTFLKHLKNNLDLISWYAYDRRLIKRLKKGLK